MTDTTARFALPFIIPGQAQKEMTHNEALATIDIALQACVVAAGSNTPPANPTPGACWILGDAPAGVWSGHARALAGWTGGGWRFVAAREGMSVWVAAEARRLTYVGGNWVTGRLEGETLTLGGRAMLAAPAAAIPDPAGGGTIDEGARVAVRAILSALRHHGLLEVQ